MSATTAVDQTLVCNIGDVTTAVTVSWTSGDNTPITDGQGGYTITQGTVSTNIQESSLTITAATLQQLDTSSVIWKCAAKSSHYPDSEQSEYKDLTLTFLTLGVVAKDSEVLEDTAATISCVVNGLTKQLDAVTWKKPSTGGVITTGTDDYQIDVGTYDSGSNSQTTILTIPGPVNGADAVYTCVIQSDEHGKTSGSEEKTDVKSNVFTIAPVVMSATTAVDQTLVCNIGDDTTAVTVSWTSGDNTPITDGQGGYTITQGTVSTNIQESSLTITAATLQQLDTSSVIWKCAAKSSHYPDSEQSEYKDLTLTFLTLGVVAKDSEVLKDTGTTISCVVTGLTKGLDAVGWKNPDGFITHGSDDIDDYQIEEGSYIFGSKSQTTVLTIPATKNTGDAVYTCVIQSAEHGKISGSEEENTVNSNVFTITPVDMSATDAVDQTLVCNIGDVTTAVTVSWTDQDNTPITTGNGYTITPGAVDGVTNIQESSLTIDTTTLKELDTSSGSVIWKCAAKSSQYPDSEQSEYKDLTVTFLTLAVEAKDSEVLKDTVATISCVVTGLTKQLDAVAWKNSDGSITHGSDATVDYQIEEGTYILGSKSQTTVLTIPATENKHDAVYTCVIQSDEHGKTSGSEEDETVNSDVFSEYLTDFNLLRMFRSLILLLVKALTMLYQWFF
ncbi:Ig heavy chain C region, secreted form-like [Bolinopsis microptera]|uniref:Ig heavy chain C region, secreted form-like n=1 Tax=Bolinopsis microptera TaxID=2820187 RepID=UPI00307A202A